MLVVDVCIPIAAALSYCSDGIVFGYVIKEYAGLKQMAENMVVEMRQSKEKNGHVQTTKTNHSGQFTFSGVAPGWHIVRVMIPTKTETTRIGFCLAFNGLCCTECDGV